MPDYLTDAIKLVVQGTVGGLVVLYFSEKIQKRKKIIFLKKVSEALIIELETHIAMWDTLLDGDPVIEEDVAALKEHSFWNKNLEPIEGMSVSHFRIVSFYFRAAFITLQRLQVRTYPAHTIKTMRITAEQALNCFEFYAATSAIDRETALANIARAERRLREIDAMRPKE